MTHTYKITATPVGEREAFVLEGALTGKVAKRAADFYRANGYPTASVSIVNDETGAVVTPNWY